MHNVAQNGSERPNGGEHAPRRQKEIPTDAAFLEELREALVDANPFDVGMVEMLAQDLELLSRAAKNCEDEAGWSDDYLSYGLFRAAKRVRLLGTIYARATGGVASAHGFPQGVGALEHVLAGDEVWPDNLSPGVTGKIVAIVREEALKPETATWPASVWRSRIRQSLRAAGVSPPHGDADEVSDAAAEE